MVQIKIKLLNEKALSPKRMSTHAAGYDIFACPEETIVLKSGERTIVKTGFSMAIPHGYEAQIRPRSGLAIKYGISLTNSPGTIDSDYRGEVGIIMINHGTEPFTVNRGDRVAQMVIAKVEQSSLELVDSLDDTERGSGGFGSTGMGNE